MVQKCRDFCAAWQLNKVPVLLLINNSAAKYVRELYKPLWGRLGGEEEEDTKPACVGISLEHKHTFFLPCRFVFELALSSSHVSISAKQLNGEVNLKDCYK